MHSLLTRPTTAPAPPRMIRLTDKQTIAANLRLESFIHEVHRDDPMAQVREIKEQLTIIKSSSDVVNFSGIAEHPWGR